MLGRHPWLEYVGLFPQTQGFLYKDYFLQATKMLENANAIYCYL